jgi:hypothetical protein
MVNVAGKGVSQGASHLLRVFSIFLLLLLQLLSRLFNVFNNRNSCEVGCKERILELFSEEEDNVNSSLSSSVEKSFIGWFLEN